jgi:hypothetical protein
MERMAGDVEKREVSTGGNGREAESERVIPGSRIIGTWEWPQNVAAVVLPHLDKKIPQSVIARLLNVN